MNPNFRLYLYLGILVLVILLGWIITKDAGLYTLAITMASTLFGVILHAIDPAVTFPFTKPNTTAEKPLKPLVPAFPADIALEPEYVAKPPVFSAGEDQGKERT